MRAFEPQPTESSKAFSAFKVYRDSGPNRSLAKTAETYYGSRKNLAQIGVWSSKFEWVDRARAYDDWLTMRDRAVIEEHEQSKAVEFAQRQMALREKLLSNAELAAEQAEKMLTWPLTEQRVLRESEDGTEVTYIFVPARWTKETARRLQEMAANALVGAWMSKEVEETGEEYDFSGLSDEELNTYIMLSGKVGMRQRPSD